MSNNLVLIIYPQQKKLEAYLCLSPMITSKLFEANPNPFMSYSYSYGGYKKMMNAFNQSHYL